MSVVKALYQQQNIVTRCYVVSMSSASQYLETKCGMMTGSWRPLLGSLQPQSSFLIISGLPDHGKMFDGQ